MECNREEAIRAKEIAERKFRAKDIVAAKKFALKAQNLNPELDGIYQMVATFDVFLASRNKIGVETDWYAILGVSPTANDDTVKKQYRKLALLLHPDKNRSIGAEGAFKFLSEAWSVLSDKNRRSLYDQKRNAKSSHKKVQQQSKHPSASPKANGFYNFPKTTSSSKPPKTSRPASSSSNTTSRPSKANTFWTSCTRCRMQYEYLRVYVNHHLVCPNCSKAFLAVETASPVNASSSVTFSFPPHYHHQNVSKTAHPTGRGNSKASNVGSAGYPNQANFQWGAFSRTAGAASAKASSSAAAHVANVVHRTYAKVRSERESKAAAKREEVLRRKNHASGKSSIISSAGNSNVVSNSIMEERPAKKRRANDNGGDTRKDEIGVGTAGRIINPNAGSSETERHNCVSRDIVTDRNVLIEKALKMICKKLVEWNPDAAIKFAVKDREKVKEAIFAGNVDANNGEFSSEHDSEKQNVAINVTDPDFHDFDGDRTEKSFDANQVWAAYDDDDGMPRFYALIQKVISYEPFKMRFSWLNSKTNSELGPIDWVCSGFTKTCGKFRVGRYEVTDTVNVFSHRVRWEKGVGGVVKIFPKRGDVWALYRNWSPDWNETTPEHVRHKYDMVEVLEDYDELGVLVTPLVKVAGFKTVFYRHMDPAEVRRIPTAEMFRFSHQVPSWLLTGEEGANAPRGCCELDPAATPSELLQVITETREYRAVKGADSAESMREPNENKMETAKSTYDSALEKTEKVRPSKHATIDSLEVTEQAQGTKNGSMTADAGEHRQELKKDAVMDAVEQMHEINGLVMA